MFARLVAPAFASALALASPAVAMDLTELTDAERAQFRAEVRAYLMENPEVILQAVEQMQNNQAQAQMQADFDLVTANADEIFDDGYSWVGGNPDGDITLVEFLDYRCGYCKRAHGEVAKLLETDGNIKLIVKEFPILGDQSLLASRFAVATKQVAGNDAYKQLNDALMAFNGEVSLPALRRLGESFELDVAAIEAKMDSDEVTQEIAQTRALAQKLQITGTPTFVMQDEMLRGYLPYDQMMALVEEKRG
ncbi:MULTISPECIES: DsbA family protein [Sulfitobacter]|uniref:Disulfide bond formation protein D n=1 Tax=Sulfitobacter dubius TaxID=218673 RepID=A0ABY3ZIP1_9RHOB|nr:DsbA family protein [Sulfitobacter dubius]UOA14446.1 Disulfide bond formation protein D [Sulfitobacter dubius]WOI30018.1 DsbA family protein [Sulfitobacter dubius]